jgi:hypothetical protein
MVWHNKKTLNMRGWKTMDKFVELSEYEARQLLSELQAADSNGPGIRKLRVYYGGGKVKFKVNEYIWSPPMGKEVVCQ